MPRNRILSEFPAAVLIQERRVTSSASEVKCPNWMMEKLVIAFCEQYTKNAPILILRNRLVQHMNIVNNNVFVLYILTLLCSDVAAPQVITHNFFYLAFANIFEIFLTLKF